MRTVDLALFADVVAARSAAVEARLKQARDRIRQSAIEREARRALSPATVERLERSGLFGVANVRAERDEVKELAESLAALRELRIWIEARLAETELGTGLERPGGGSPCDSPRAA
jgi:hypothetical protein